MKELNVLENRAILEYKRVAMEMLHYSFPLLTAKELSDAVDYSMIKRCRNSEATIENNYKNAVVNTTLLEIADYILDREPIITAQGTLFARHGTVPNPLAKMVEKFINQRKYHKKLMFSHSKGTESYKKYNLLQLLNC